MMLASLDKLEIDEGPEAPRCVYKLSPESTDVGKHHGAVMIHIVDEITEYLDKDLVGELEHS